MFRKLFLVFLGLAIITVAYHIITLHRSQSALGKIDRDYSIGNEHANLHVVEFLDYGCGYCREAHPTITQAIAQDGKIIYSPRPVAFLGNTSAYAAKTVYAAAKHGKFEAMHNAIMDNFDAFSKQGLDIVAPIVELDSQTIQDTMSDEDIAQRLEKNEALFDKVGTGKTPTFIIGGKIIYVPEGQMPSVQDFIRMFAEARNINGIEE